MRKDTKKPAPVSREFLQSSTMMAEAFREAGTKFIRDLKAGYAPTSNQSAIVPLIEEALERGQGEKKRPAWTVSKRPAKTARKVRK